jgi:type IV secretory pathway VirD2 relaxase
MILSDDDRPVRIRPRKPRMARRESAAWAAGYRLLMHYARSSRRFVRNAGAQRATGASRPHSQRCAVRVTYLNNRTRGQWRAHGRYLSRESAIDGKAVEAGFNRDLDGVNVVRELERWQSAGDQRLWKVILSPEFGDRIDLQRLTRDLAGQLANDLGTDLEWVAVAHHNTEHPHVHMVIRGVRNDGQPLRFMRDYLKHGIRGIAEDSCTRQLGYRTSLDAAEAARREIGETRFTSLDRAMLREAQKSATGAEPSYFIVVKNPAQAGLNDSARPHLNHVAARLAVLQRMGLAESTAPHTWHVRYDVEEVLRAMQRASDRQNTLAAHGVPISDKRLPTEILEMRQLTSVEGRILVHGQDEQSEQNYLILEGTDAKVRFIYYTPEMEEARSRGGLRTNSFVRLRKLSIAGRSTLDIRDLGDAEKLLNNRRLLEENARALLKREAIPTEDGWGGWLGKYQAALASAANEIGRNRELRSAPSPERRRDRSSRFTTCRMPPETASPR